LEAGSGAIVSFGDSQFRGFTETGDEVDRQRPRAQATLLTAAKEEGLERRLIPLPPAHNERADSFGRVDFVAADADQVDPGIAQGCDQPSEGLGRVDMKPDISSVEHGRNLVDRLNDAGFVIGMHHADQQGIGAQGVADDRGVHPSPAIRPDMRDFESAPFEFRQRLEHGMMLNRSRYDVAASLLFS
jgi:hypothetical protein